MMYRAEVDAGRTTVKGRVSRNGEIAVYNIRLDDDSYEWLRRTAFEARTSINALVVAALARAHAAQTEGTGTPAAD